MQPLEVSKSQHVELGQLCVYVYYCRGAFDMNQKSL